MTIKVHFQMGDSRAYVCSGKLAERAHSYRFERAILCHSFGVHASQ